MKKDNVLLIIGISLIVLGLFSLFVPRLIFVANLSDYTYETPCVDGVGNINLNGIMCNKTIKIFYDAEEENFSDIPELIGFFVIIGGLIVTAIVINTKVELSNEKTKRKV